MSDRGRHDGRSITIRRALPADATALENLAVLDDAAPLEGDLIVAVLQNEIWAARSLGDGRTLADPFRPTEEARALLALRAAHLNGIALRRTGAVRSNGLRRYLLRQQPS